MIEVLDHAVLRCARWPIETVELFAEPDVAELASALLEVERDMATRRDALLPELEDLVPLLADRQARAWALRTCRRLYATAHAEVDLSQPVLDAVGQAAPAFAQGVRELANRRREWSRRRREPRATLRRRHAGTARQAARGHRRRALRSSPGGRQSRGTRPLGTAGCDGSAAGARPCDQRLEATVFHFLMRAAGRATPHGAWAGVVSIDPSSHRFRSSGSEQYGITLVASPGRVHVTPDLVRSAPSSNRSPSIGAIAGGLRCASRPVRIVFVEGSWWYERSTGDAARWCALPDHPLAQALLEVFGDRQPRHVGPVVDELARSRTIKCRLGPL